MTTRTSPHRRSTTVVVVIALVALLAGAVTWMAVADDGGSSASATPAGSGAPAATDGDSTDEPSWLFSVTAAGGTFTPPTGDASVLTLTGVDRRLTAFTDRPDRDAATIPIGALFAAWPEMFASDPPNAVLAVENPDGDSVSLVVTLTNPRLDGDTATFDARIVQTRARRPELAALLQSAAGTPPATFGTARLFIDDTTEITACVDKDLELVNPPGEIATDADDTDQATFRQECNAAGGHTVVRFAG